MQAEQEEIVRNMPRDQKGLTLKEIRKMEYLSNNFTPKAGTFLPFGAGSRLCPGNDLAKLEISIFLHYFLLGYE
nr:ent-kaurenoic acid oxidase 2-like [Ipomoea batatas]